MEKIVQDMAQKVDDFQKKFQIPYVEKLGLPPRSRFDHLDEELREIKAAHDIGDITEVIDGLVDLVYVALGALLQMGIHPTHPFDVVHEANMKKVARKTARHDHDVVKPEGWQPPNHVALLERLEVLHRVSPVFVDLTRLRIHKGNNYNRGTVRRSDHFVFGDMSFLPVIWMKICRVRSLTECPGNTPEEKEESRRLVRRELSDIIVYSCFWEENMRGLDL